MLYRDYCEILEVCPFCDGKNHELVTYETAFLTYALALYHQHHLLVIPRRHVESFLKLDAEEYGEISGLLRYGVRLLHQLGYHDCTILVRDGKKAGKSIPHLHYHIVPVDQIGDLNHKGEPRRILTKTEVKRLITDFNRAAQKTRSGGSLLRRTTKRI